jgi:hypothetical protein
VGEGPVSVDTGIRRYSSIPPAFPLSSSPSSPGVNASVASVLKPLFLGHASVSLQSFTGTDQANVKWAAPAAANREPLLGPPH